ncbi:hypothetical protein E2C01_027346 [Portunus trituberculatus]|uniref:Uncharacterized protein n=1 Tax=Portunus trituberculatus TaxID=210409 RepID=A0A5B7ELB0_PORTR|nr:hypothetical protein [Portunus trituberculatus]
MTMMCIQQGRRLDHASNPLWGEQVSGVSREIEHVPPKLAPALSAHYQLGAPLRHLFHLTRAKSSATAVLKSDLCPPKYR